MIKITTGLGLTLLCTITVVARSAQPTQFPASPDGFKEFVLNKTTAEEIVGSLGQPQKDRTDNLEVSKIGKWLDARHHEKIFRQLTYTKLGDFYKMEFSLLENKLVMIELEFKRDVPPSKLKRIFGVDFAELGGPSNLPDTPGQYPKIQMFTTTYPPYYSMVGFSENTFIYVNCISGGGGPGKVERTRQISRVLEKK